MSGWGQGEPRAASALPRGLPAPLGSRSGLCQAGWSPPVVGHWPLCSEVLCVGAGVASHLKFRDREWIQEVGMWLMNAVPLQTVNVHVWGLHTV